MRGIADGDIWGPTDVYTVRLPLPGDSKPLVMGQVLEGMKPSDKPVDGPKNHPMMPVAWTKSYKGASGQTGRVFTTTMGSSVDLASEGLRRLLVNASYWCVGLEDKIPDRAKVDIVDMVPELVRSYDEPFAADSAIPTFILAKLARPPAQTLR